MLIDKEVLLKDLEETVVFSGRPQMVGLELYGANKVISRIKMAPAVDPEDFRPKGRWIPQDESLTRFMCSVCKAKNYGGHEKYCPNCGAKMK